MEKGHKQQSVIYQANPQMIEWVQKTRQESHAVCSQNYMRPVRVETIHGQQYEGRIVNIDQQYLYLEVYDSSPQMRQFYPPFYPPYGAPYASPILPLVLFDLLAISLLY